MGVSGVAVVSVHDLVRRIARMVRFAMAAGG